MGIKYWLWKNRRKIGEIKYLSQLPIHILKKEEIRMGCKLIIVQNKKIKNKPKKDSKRLIRLQKKNGWKSWMKIRN